MRIALLATGDELIEGTTLNTNTHHLAKHLFAEGFTLGLQMMCNDREEEIIACIQHLLATHDTLIITGGLGPTSDDKTRFALAKAIHEPLIAHEKALTHLSYYLKRANLALDTGNHQQSLFPKDALLLANPFGTALGCIIQHNHKTIALLPGPPRECLPMFAKHLLPKLLDDASPGLAKLHWLVFGLPEAAVAQRLDEAVSHIPCQTGYRFDPPYVECKVRCETKYVSAVEAIVEPLLRPHCLMPTHQRASLMLKEKLRTLKYPIYILDNATGGLLETILLNPETYAQVKFQTPTDTDALYFECTGLAAYWEQTRATEAAITLKSMIKQEVNIETTLLSYRSPLIVNMAAEWLSAKILASFYVFH